jgi:competence protein ComGC
MPRTSTEKVFVNIVMSLVLVVLIVLVTYVLGGLFKKNQSVNLEGPFWLDSLVCTESVCTMSIRNSYENRMEVIVSRETANHVYGISR